MKWLIATAGRGGFFVDRGKSKKVCYVAGRQGEKCLGGGPYNKVVCGQAGQKWEKKGRWLLWTKVTMMI